MNLPIVVDKILFFLYGCFVFERKLIRYQGYRHNSIIQWHKSLGIPWRFTKKILSRLEIFDGQKIRSVITEAVSQNKAIFDSQNCFVTSFGSEGKSGVQILYDFRHVNNYKDNTYKTLWDLSNLPEGSKIVFVDDIVATGTQSVGLINNRLNPLLNPSYEPYLFSICATREGINHVEENTNFKVIAGIILEESEHFHYRPNSKYFSDNEKQLIIEMNQLLNPGSKVTNFDLGLLIAFYYAVPNNSMTILWKDNFPYKIKAKTNKWFALLPRKF